MPSAESRIDEEHVAAVRAFNRFYTPLIGLLGDRFLGTPYSLTEGRVIFELAQREETEVVELRRELDLDAGYLSRILARFEAAGIARASARGSPRRTGCAPGASCASRSLAGSPSSAYCSSSRASAGWASAAGWSTSACRSRVRPVTGR